MTISKFKFGTYFIIDPEKHLISCNFVAHLGIDPNEVDRYVTTPLIKQEMEYLILGKAYKQTVSDKVGQYEHYMLTLSQVNEVMANAPQSDMVLELVAFISQEIIPLFNPLVKVEPAQNEHSHKFHSDLFGDLTVLTHDDGSLWFIGKEVAEKLGYGNPHEAIRTHCKGVSEIRTPSKGGMQTVKIIPERDVYRLVMRSKLPTAEKFEEFVVSEVLPSIRKTGSYGQIAAPTVSQPAELSRKDLLLMALRSEEEKEQLQFERDEAVRCKSWISKSREASAMGKLARANDKVRQLEAKLAIVNQAPEYAYATVLAIQSRLKHLKVSGLKLTYYCRNNGLLVKDIPDERYGVVHSYPAAAWQDVYQIDINNVLNKVA